MPRPTRPVRNLHSALCILRSAFCLLTSALVLSGCSQLKRLSPADRLTPSEQTEYLVLRTLSPSTAADYLNQASASERAELADWFWQHNPDTAGSSTVVRAGFLNRAATATRFFGGIDLLNDDRVAVYIRHGAPRRETFEPRTAASETLTVYVNRAEIWTYPSVGRQFDFVKTGTAFKLVGESRFGPGARPPSLEEVDLGRPAPKPAPDARRLPVALTLHRLGQRDGTVTIEVHYGLTPADWATGVAEPVHVLVKMTDAGKTVDSLPAWVMLGQPDGAVVGELAVGRGQFAYAPGDYTVEVTAVTASGSAFGQASARVNTIEYSRADRPVSDIILYSLVDSTFQSPQFARAEWQRVVPLAASRVGQGSAFYALYEVYDLGLDSLGRHSFEAAYEIIERDEQSPAVIATPVRNYFGSGRTATVVERVHTMDLRAGRYLLVTKVRDGVSGRQSSGTVEFDITRKP